MYADKFENTYIKTRYEWFIAFYTAAVVIACKSGCELSGIDTVTVQNYKRQTNLGSEYGTILNRMGVFFWFMDIFSPHAYWSVTCSEIQVFLILKAEVPSGACQRNLMLPW